jgi:DNA-binding response OmpR family regulator
METIRKRILVVDDDPEITRMLQLMLEFQGYEVKRAHGTAQGMTILGAEIPDLVLLDFMMPHLNGIELCTYLRRDPRTAHVPVVMYSAAANEENMQAALEAGATRFVHKTTDSDELLNVVKEVLSAP